MLVSVVALIDSGETVSYNVGFNCSMVSLSAFVLSLTSSEAGVVFGEITFSAAIVTFFFVVDDVVSINKKK